MSYEVDARGLACPQPVIKTRKALEQYPGGNFSVLVDNESSRDNVMRMLKSRGYTSSSSLEGSDHRIVVGEQTGEQPVQTESGSEEITCPSGQPSGNLVIYLNSNRMGSGNEKLGYILIRGFLQTLKDLPSLPSDIVCVNSGVFLTTQNEETVAALKELENRGVNVLSCGTCLDFYELKDTLAVGKVSNMFEIAETLCGAGKVVSP